MEAEERGIKEGVRQWEKAGYLIAITNITGKAVQQIVDSIQPSGALLAHSKSGRERRGSAYGGLVLAGGGE